MPWDKTLKRCYLPNAAIAWKQSNGFYYPPAFHSANLYFGNVDIRHFVLSPVFVEGTPKGAAVAFVDLQELKVRADVTNLPERIVVNVDGLTDGTKVLLKDVVLPEGAELDMDDPETSVVSVEVPEDTTESAAAAPAADADAAAAAPAADADAK